MCVCSLCFAFKSRSCAVLVTTAKKFILAAWLVTRARTDTETCWHQIIPGWNSWTPTPRSADCHVTFDPLSCDLCPAYMNYAQVEGGDYVNASHIDFPSAQNGYIVTQVQYTICSRLSGHIKAAFLKVHGIAPSCQFSFEDFVHQSWSSCTCQLRS